MNQADISIIQGWPDDLDVIASFLDRNWEYDSINSQLLKEKLFDDPLADPELCLTAFQDNQPVGFMYCVRRNIRGQAFGYIKLMAVDEKLRRRKIGSLLYEKAEKLLREKGAKTLRIYDVPLNYFMPGIDPRYTPAICFALKKGFSKFGEAVNMIVDLNSDDWNTLEEEKKLQPQGIEVRRATSRDKAAIMELLSKEWVLWNNEVNMAMKDKPISVHLAFLKDELKAFSVHNGNNKGTGWFGPMGTHPDIRGTGLGSILLKRCLKDMQKQGYSQAIIPWVAPIAFYAHYANARINRVFWRMEKTFNEP